MIGKTLGARMADVEAPATIVGVKPWLPPPLSRSAWWTSPIPAERLAAVRVAVGAMLLLDIFGTYVPRLFDLFGPESLTRALDFARPISTEHRQLFLHLTEPWQWTLLFGLWTLAAIGLIVGAATRLAAGFAWFVSASLVAMNPMLHNAGDQVRTILLLILTIAPASAVWSVSRPRSASDVGIYPWPLRLLYVQMAIIYFMNGLFKLLGPEWRSGDALSIVLGDSGWIRFSLAGWTIPGPILLVSVWLVLAWELTFPLLVLAPRWRIGALIFGIVFHLSTAALMRVGMFPAYMLCFYAMFVPWEWRPKVNSQ